MAERQSAHMSKITNDGLLNPVLYRMLYTCIHATVGVKELMTMVARLEKAKVKGCFANISYFFVLVCVCLNYYKR